MKKIILITALFTMLLTTLAVAQNQTIKGKVTDESGAMVGVSVLVQGTNKGGSTDVDGNYAIQIAPGETTLVFTFIGYRTQTVEIGNRTVIDVTMEADATELSEVVVVGYGVQKKSDVTGSTATVKGDLLTKQPVLTATQALQGQVAGVQIIGSSQPGSSPQIRVRGVGTMYGSTNSLFVVDGVLTDDISNINTADIVDMNILKDASSAAIYGSRGANGVIIITTKKGTTDGLKINYNNSLGFRQATNLVEMANAEEYRNYAQAATGAVPESTPYNTDWYDVILRPAFQQIHNISLSNGSEKATYLFNVGYLQDQGVVIENEFKRFTLRLNGDYKISKMVTAGLQTSYANANNQNGFNNLNIDAYGNIGTVYNDAYRASPIIPSMINGLYGNTSSFQNVGNPLLDVQNNDINVKENRLMGSSFLEVKPVTWLALRTSIGGEWRNSLNRAYNYEFSAADGKTFITPGGNQYNTNSRLQVKQTQAFRWVWDNIATVTKSFEEHNVTFLAGVTAERYNQHWLSATRLDVPADKDLWYIGVGDANTSQNDGGGDAWARNSYLARINYSFNEKYMATFSYRMDGSSRLPTKNRWQDYPSAGLAWLISRENFMQNQNIFDMLKMRVSYGEVGNDQIPTNSFTPTLAQNMAYNFNGSVSPAVNGVQNNRILDPNITWENTQEFDVALEFAVLESRLTGEINYYDKKVKNLLADVAIPRTVGDADGLITTNIGTVQNKGIELVLNWKDKLNDNFSYFVNGNVTFNHNEMIALNGGQNRRDGSAGGGQGQTTNTDNGHPIGSFYVLKVIGVFNSVAEINAYQDSEGNVIQGNAKPGDFKYLDKDKDGKITPDDCVFAGSYQPVAYFGLNMGFNFKNWDFSINFYGNAGNEVYNAKKGARVDARDNVEKDVVYNRWTSSNHTQTEPRANEGYLPASTYFVEPGDFLRINNLTIGYNFSTSFLQRLHISNLRVFATSQNLLTLKKYSGFTSELPGGPLNSGIEASAYPATRTLAVGLNLGF